MAEFKSAAKKENLERMIDFILSCSERVGFSKKERNEIHLASEEILMNIISYAYPEESVQGEVLIRCTCLPGKSGIRVEFIDSGVPFNPLHSPEPDITLPMEKRQIGGLGLFLVENVMDSIEYKRTSKNNHLIIEKRARG